MQDRGGDLGDQAGRFRGGQARSGAPATGRGLLVAASPGRATEHARLVRANVVKVAAMAERLAVFMLTIVRERRCWVTGAGRRLDGEARHTPGRAWRAGPGRAGRRSGSEVGEDGEHPAVLGVVGRQAELGEDVADVLFHRAGRDHRRWAIAGLE